MLSRLSIAQRITAGFAILIALMIAVGIVGTAGMKRQNSQVQELLGRDIKLYQTVVNGQARMSKMRRDEKDVFLSLGNEAEIADYQKKWQQSLDRVGESLRTLREMSPGDDHASLQQAEEAMQKYSGGMNEMISQMRSEAYTSSRDVNNAFEPFKKDAQTATKALDQIAKEADTRIKGIDGELAGIFRQVATLGLTLVIVAVIAGCVGGFTVVRSVSAPLRRLQQTIQRIQGSGRIGERMTVTSGDEIGKTSRAFNQLLETMCGIISDAGRNSGELVNMAQALRGAADNVKHASSQQADAAHATAAAIEQLTSSIAQIAQRAQDVEQVAGQMAHTASTSLGHATGTAGQIREIAGTILQSAELVESLNHRSDEIGGIVLTIKEIADQTSLLALNAAIEAARAGEQGRGFAVVADEVRKLAERTTSATVDIQNMIEVVQRDTGTTATNMQTVRALIEQGVSNTEQVAATLQQIEQLATQSAHHTSEIALAIREQSAASEDISSHVDEIAAASASNNASAGETSRSALQLTEISQQLDRTIQHFSV
ncbi:MAG: methyl-accepting chemotaxis protein [Candidatus Dactylopiibacterium sp.]|nr:methyl-accepting chemotaxis protein [Candidatus Dactylopiibacterium sp.]